MMHVKTQKEYVKVTTANLTDEYTIPMGKSGKMTLRDQLQDTHLRHCDHVLS